MRHGDRNVEQSGDAGDPRAARGAARETRVRWCVHALDDGHHGTGTALCSGASLHCVVRGGSTRGGHRRVHALVVLLVVLLVACAHHRAPTLTALQLASATEHVSARAHADAVLLVHLIAQRPQDRFLLGDTLARLDAALDEAEASAPAEHVAVARALAMQLRLVLAMPERLRSVVPR